MTDTDADTTRRGPRAEIGRLLEGLSMGRRTAISEALNLVDDRRSDRRALALELLDALERRAAAPRAHTIGLTGAPGSGKSSLMNAIIDALRGDGRSIGVIAVDPSSQTSGGALLGDRMRIGSSAREQGVFLRSMAARDRLGGLADATFASVAVLSAVFDLVFVETVGIGQSECDVASVVDTLVFVAQPGAGDVLQFMKAGILEYPDIFVVNKSDTGAAAERTRRELASGLGMGDRTGRGHDGTRPARPGAQVLLASARDREGIDAIVQAVDDDLLQKRATGALETLRAASRLAFVRESLLRRYGEYGIERVGGLAAIERRLASADGRSAYRLVLDIGGEIEARSGPPA